MPARELPFAGHPTIGTSFVLMDEGLVSSNSERFILEEKVGPVTIRVDKGERLIWLRTPPISEDATFDRQICAQVLGLGTSDLLQFTPQLMSAGNPTLFVALRDKDGIARARFAQLRCPQGCSGNRCACLYSRRLPTEHIRACSRPTMELPKIRQREARRVH
jgi:PhzF family phenazine biosynthesis protein